MEYPKGGKYEFYVLWGILFPRGFVSMGNKPKRHYAPYVYEFRRLFTMGSDFPTKYSHAPSLSKGGSNADVLASSLGTVPAIVGVSLCLIMENERIPTNPQTHKPNK